MPFAKKDTRFVFWAAIASLLFVSFMHIIAPADSSAGKDHMIASEGDQLLAMQAVTPMTLDQLSAKLAKGEQDTLLIIHTSWCPYCRKIMPKMIRDIQSGKLDPWQVIFLSVDKDQDQFINYMAASGYYQHFTPYIYADNNTASLRPLLSHYGMHFDGGIPYAAVISKDGSMLAETRRGNWSSVNKQLGR